MCVCANSSRLKNATKPTFNVLSALESRAAGTCCLLRLRMWFVSPFNFALDSYVSMPSLALWGTLAVLSVVSYMHPSTQIPVRKSIWALYMQTGGTENATQYGWSFKWLFPYTETYNTNMRRACEHFILPKIYRISKNRSAITRSFHQATSGYLLAMAVTNKKI